MPEAFDAYHKWLGIPPAEQPPHHYRLLGIGLFEQDPDVIESAADQRMSHLRTFQGGAHSALSQKLLNEVSAAKVCLLAADRKAAYDAELRRRTAPPKPAAERPLPMAKPLAIDPPAVIVTNKTGGSHGAPPRRRQARRSAAVWWSAGAAALSALALAGFMASGGPEPDARAARGPSSPRPPAAARPNTVSAIKSSQPAPVLQPPPSEAPVANTNRAVSNTASGSAIAASDLKPAAPDEAGPPIAMAPFDEKQARAHQEAWAAHLKVPVEQKNSLGMSLVLVPPGEFTMGSAPEQIAAAKKSAGQENEGDLNWTLGRIEAEAPAHRVKIRRPFLVGATEVAVGQYRRFVEATSYVTETERFGGGHSISKEEQDPNKKNLTWRTAASEESPVGNITWNDAVAFCNWLSEREKMRSCYRGDEQGDWTLSAAGDGYRLPTEAEWEYACRAGTTTQYGFADDASTFARHGWSAKAESFSGSQTVGGKAANPFGLYDMHGNVEEWCHDWFSPNYYGQSPPDDPTGPASSDHRIRRGGAADSPIVRCRSAFRGAYPPHYRFGNLGFRVVRISTTVDADAPSLAASNEKSAEMPKPEQAGQKPRSLGDLVDDKKDKPETSKSSAGSEAPLAAVEAFTLQQHTGAVTRVAFHPFLPLLVSGGKDGRVLLWDLEKRTLLSQFDKFNEEVWTVKFSPDGNVLSYANRNHWGSVVPFKAIGTTKEVKRLKDFKSGGGAVGSLAFSPDGTFFATGQDDGTVRLWETAGFQEIAPLSVGSSAMSLVFGPITADRKRKPFKYLLAVGCRAGDIKTLELTLIKDKDGARWKFAPSAVAFPKLAGVLCVRFSPDGKLLASGRFGGLISLFNPETGELVRDIRMNARGANLDWLSFHPRLPWLVAAHWQDRRARIWNYETGEMLCELPQHASGVPCAEFSRDGRRVATASEDFSIKLWDLSGPEIGAAPKRAKKTKPAMPIVGD
jgi:formylglycine-generating enzyme required for sulfatase activity/WD40 repeat protein